MPREKKQKITRRELIKRIENDLVKKDVNKTRLSKKKFQTVNEMILKAVETQDVETWFNYINEFIIFLIKKNRGSPGKGVNLSKSEIYKGLASTTAYFGNIFCSVFVSLLPHNGYNIYISKYYDGGFTEPIKMCYNNNIEEYIIKEGL